MLYHMKHSIMLWLTSLILVMMTSCSLDGPDPMNISQELEPVIFQLKFGELNSHDTRALASGYHYSDGKSISVLKGYVYNQSNGFSAAPIKDIDVNISELDGKRGGEISIMLPKGQTFDIVFLGTSIAHNNSSSKLFFNSSDRTLNVNYGLVSCNDEELDCFFAVASDVTTETVQEEAIELKRPLAQLNVGTKDLSEYNTLTPVKDVSVTVKGIYNKIDLMSGDVVGNPINVSFLPSAIPTGQTFPVDGYTYLSMNYLLVGPRKLVDLSFTVNHQSSTNPSKTVNIGDVAVERNFQTNVYGKALLTEEISTE